MMNIPIGSHGAADELLTALAEQLAARGESFVVVVVGGSALLALDLGHRPTRDVDVLAIQSGDRLVTAEPLPEVLVAARDVVARDFGLPSDWLNAGPASLVDLGLPEGLKERAERRVYGPGLTVLFASRFDQIHLKLYATVDQGAGKHLTDLTALNPTADELLAAARWTRTHDPSEGYRTVLTEVLAHFGVPDGSLDG
jgi:hypothetical protein